MTGSIRFPVCTASSLMSPRRMAWRWALRFANNYYNTSQNAYGLKETDLAVMFIARHKATSFGYNDAIWAKYGKQFSEQSEFTDPRTKQPPTVNVYAKLDDGSGDPVSGAMPALIKKGIHFGVCATATPGHRWKNRRGCWRRYRCYRQGAGCEPNLCERAFCSGRNCRRESRARTRLFIG